jgi:hypothetical protein
MAKKSILPILALGGVAPIMLKKSGAMTAISHTVDGLARKIKGDIEHGDILEGPHEFKPQEKGDTLVVRNTPAGWEYNVEFMGEEQVDIPKEYHTVDLHHDKETGVLYATAIIDGSKFGGVDTSSGDYATGLENRTFIVGRPPSSSGWADPKQYVAIFSAPA